MTEEQFQKAVEDRVKELLGTIKGLGSLYVEPGDLIVVSVDEDIKTETLEMISRAMRSMFNESPGLIVPGSIGFTVVKRSDKKQGLAQQSLEQEAPDTEWKPGPV